MHPQATSWWRKPNECIISQVITVVLDFYYDEIRVLY